MFGNCDFCNRELGTGHESQCPYHAGQFNWEQEMKKCPPGQKPKKAKAKKKAKGKMKGY